MTIEIYHADVSKEGFGIMLFKCKKKEKNNVFAQVKNEYIILLVIFTSSSRYTT